MKLPDVLEKVEEVEVVERYLGFLKRLDQALESV